MTEEQTIVHLNDLAFIQGNLHALELGIAFIGEANDYKNSDIRVDEKVQSSLVLVKDIVKRFERVREELRNKVGESHGARSP